MLKYSKARLMNDYQRRLAAAKEEMERAGVPNARRGLTLVALLSKLGVQMRPALYLPFWLNGLIQGALFAAIYGTATYVLFGLSEERSLSQIAINLLIAGSIYGLLTAFFQRRKIWGKKLSAWEDL